MTQMMNSHQIEERAPTWPEKVTNSYQRRPSDKLLTIAVQTIAVAKMKQ